LDRFWLDCLCSEDKEQEQKIKAQKEKKRKEDDRLAPFFFRYRKVHYSGEVFPFFFSFFFFSLDVAKPNLDQMGLSTGMLEVCDMVDEVQLQCCTSVRWSRKQRGRWGFYFVITFPIFIENDPIFFV
jgi:hypothetical protein